ncbi:MAG: SurA N-terminal domain-containing protein [Acidobacteria bacterium]|nr:SurA N-terminal domain-containing protein [Acidobacteriota bacterium]
MFATIRKHQTWLWGLIIAATIVSFVIFFTPGATRNRGGGQSQFGQINGRPITAKMYLQAYNEAQIQQFLRSGSWPDRGDARRTSQQLDLQARQRLVMIDRMKKLGVQVSDAMVAKWIEDNFNNNSQPNSARAMYLEVVSQLARRGLTEGSLVDFIRHEVGIAHLIAVVGLAGEPITPREAAAQYRRLNERLDADAVVFSSSNFLASVQVDPDQLTRFYTNRQQFYRIPEKVQVQYVRFDFTNYSAQAEEFLTKRTNLTAEIDALYLKAGANRFMDTNGQVMTPEAAKAKIRAQTVEEHERLAARREAAKFGTELEKLKPSKAENLATLAATKGMPVNTTAPFSEVEGPREISQNQAFARAAFSLSEAQPISSGVVGEDAVYILALKDHLPSEVPPLEAVRERVSSDFKRDQAQLLAREAGTNFVTSLTNLLAQGKSFTNACAEAKVTPITLPQFTPSSRSLPNWDRRINLEQAKYVAQKLETGKASALIPTADGGFVLYLKAREAVTDAELKDALPGYLAELRQQGEFSTFNDWFQHQIELTGITMPSANGESQ